jgi:hypothetical protein
LNKETIESILAVVQILSLVALVVYVIMTWRMASATKKSAEAAEKTLQEMKEMRDQETAPHVVAYFEAARGTPFIYLVVKNLGKSVAKAVRLDFDPGLRSSNPGIQMDELPMIRQGIGSLAPGQELRTFFDSAISYFGAELPLRINVRVSYSGGVHSEERKFEQILDLEALRGLFYSAETGLAELVSEVAKIAKGHNSNHSDLQNIARILDKRMDSEAGTPKKHGWRPRNSKRV